LRTKTRGSSTILRETPRGSINSTEGISREKCRKVAWASTTKEKSCGVYDEVSRKERQNIWNDISTTNELFSPSTKNNPRETQSLRT